MKVALILIALSGFILSINAVCDMTACGEPFGSNCTAEKNYVKCLKNEADGCKATASDIASKTAIEAAIAAEKIAMGIQGCGASAVTISAATLLLSLVAAYLKL